MYISILEKCATFLYHPVGVSMCLYVVHHVVSVVCVVLTLSYVDVILSSYNSHEPDEYDVFRQTMKVTVSLQPLGDV